MKFNHTSAEHKRGYVTELIKLYYEALTPRLVCIYTETPARSPSGIDPLHWNHCYWWNLLCSMLACAAWRVIQNQTEEGYCQLKPSHLLTRLLSLSMCNCCYQWLECNWIIFISQIITDVHKTMWMLITTAQWKQILLSNMQWEQRCS